MSQSAGAAPSVPTSVDRATTSLESSVTTFLSRQRQKRNRKRGGEDDDERRRRLVEKLEGRAERAARHGSHVLRQLVLKRQALALAVRALGPCTDQCLEALGRAVAVAGRNDATVRTKGSNASSKSSAVQLLQSVLAHWFAVYLRCRDGAVLLTSGECRHPADSRRALSSSSSSGTADFKSHLGGGSGNPSTLRGDGYTSLYSSRMGYAGFGWDEFFDEDVGVRRRLVDACLGCAGAKRRPGDGGGGGYSEAARTKLWERLCDYGAEAFESELDGHEVAVRAVVGELDALAGRFVDGANRVLEGVAAAAVAVARGGGRGGGRLVLTSTDKFERLELQNGSSSSFGISNLVIERRGDDFRVDDEGGVLPSDWDGRRWDDAVRLPGKMLGGDEGGRLRRQGDGKASSGDVIAVGKGNKRPGTHNNTTAAAGVARKKMRRIIEDDDSSEDDDGVIKPAQHRQRPSTMRDPSLKKKGEAEAGSSGSGAKIKARTNEGDTSGGGLKVKVKKAEASGSGSSSAVAGVGTASLNAIKSKLGVDAESLERGREDLEAQQRDGTAAAVAEEATVAGICIGGSGASGAAVMLSPELAELMEDVSQLKEDVKSFERVLGRIGANEMEDRWDARESLRESKMALGNLLLELHSNTYGDSSDQTLGGSSPLKQAEALFQDSVVLVAGQFADYEQATKNESQEKRDAFRRNLLLLRGRAETNLGISLIEQAMVQQRAHINSPLAVGDGTERSSATSILLKAIDCLKKAAEGARAMHSHASLALSSISGDDKEEAAIHLIRARELEVLATRRHGDALWHVGRRKDSIRKLEEAVESTDGSDDGSFPPSESLTAENVQVNLDLLVEQYFAATSLVDHATAAAEKIPLVQKSKSGVGGAGEGDEMIGVACRGYSHAADISDKITRLTELPSSPSTLQEMHDGYDVASRADLMVAMKGLKEWWEERKSAKSRTSEKMQSQRNMANLHRSYLGISSHGRPSARIILSSGRVPNRRHQQPGIHRRPRGKSKSSKSTPSKLAGNNPDQLDAFLSGALDRPSGAPAPSRQSHVVFRKWGDELLPQIAKEGGGTTALLPYPACAPEMPQDMRQ